MRRGCLVTFVVLCTCVGHSAPKNPRALTLATTTSTQDTGLLDHLAPLFKKRTGIELKVIAVGTGQALELARRGDADVVMVHARKAEDKFVADGSGVNRKDVMYNDFVIVGPAADPAKVTGEVSAVEALSKIVRSKATFISRGDNSGTHTKEQELWQDAKITPTGTWYLSAGAGMSETLLLANEKGGYTISDRATYLSQKKNLHLIILLQGDRLLFNPYGVIAVSPEKFSHVNYEGALKFINFLLSQRTQKTIANFGKEKYGQPLFFTYIKGTQRKDK